MTDVRLARALGSANLLTGAAVALAAARVARVVGDDDAIPDPRILRALGARQAVQGLLTVAVPTDDVLWVGAGVDASHAASMLPLLLTRFRRAAMLSATLAAASALAGRTVRAR